MSRLQPGLVSTIIPVHNRGGLLREAVASVLEQTYGEVEVIIVDDGSTDDTAAIADDLARLNPEKVKVIHKQNSGPGPSRQAGLERAGGEFIQFLDSDDLLHRDKFADQVAMLREHPDAALCYGITFYYRLGNESAKTVFAESDQHFERIFPAFLARRRWGTSSPVYRRSVLDGIGAWGDMWSEEDWEYDCRIGALRQRIVHCNRLGSFQRGLVGQRLSQQGRDNRRILQSQSRARQRICGHAKTAGVPGDSSEAVEFCRSVFMLARDCGGAGLVDDARALLEMVEAYARDRRLLTRIRAYRTLSSLWGWKTSSRLARFAERLRGGAGR